MIWRAQAHPLFYRIILKYSDFILYAVKTKNNKLYFHLSFYDLSKSLNI